MTWYSDFIVSVTLKLSTGNILCTKGINGLVDQYPVKVPVVQNVDSAIYWMKITVSE